MEVQGTVRGAGGPTVELDMARGKDREYIRRGIASGWPITASDLCRYKAGLDHALDLAQEAGDAREINACVKTLAVIVGQMQADEHLAERVRLDAKSGNVTNNIVVFQIGEAKPPHALPEPAPQTT